MDGPPWENQRQEDIPQQRLIYREGLERLSTPLIGTRFLQQKKQPSNKQLNKSSGGGAQRLKCLEWKSEGQHAETPTFNYLPPVFSAACNILAFPQRPQSAVQ